ncbi:hypothetical protein EPA93_29325 [Ktedonosporobacter rubrisoli]|uniref:Uncharacterized protein n=1 Tax=Ktedonosporobacter rubrisoli TaxID=2509675 RepID=A0A4P6JWX3_KTERU|nr:hypothetical protein [Ktedonosporobacter rubrisoli]QBD79860.1 hypothetical protein EPA93_29325 [Ktedonosporobacter rubrisoli]
MGNDQLQGMAVTHGEEMLCGLFDLDVRVEILAQGPGSVGPTSTATCVESCPGTCTTYGLNCGDTFATTCNSAVASNCICH